MRVSRLPFACHRRFRCLDTRRKRVEMGGQYYVLKFFTKKIYRPSRARSPLPRQGYGRQRPGVVVGLVQPRLLLGLPLEKSQKADKGAVPSITRRHVRLRVDQRSALASRVCSLLASQLSPARATNCIGVEA